MIVDFKPEHLEMIRLQGAQAFIGDYLSDPGVGVGLARYEAYTAIHGDRVTACAGIIPRWNGLVEAWTLLSESGPRAFLEAHLAIRRWLSLVEVRRMQTYVAVGHEEGVRWMAKLGFFCEARMEGFLPCGNDAWLYARVNHGS